MNTSLRPFALSLLALAFAMTAHAAPGREEKTGKKKGRPAEQTQPVAEAGNEKKPVDKEKKTITLVGKLEGGVMAIGGESTGWRLTIPGKKEDAKKGKSFMDVDMSAIKDAESFDGKKAAITGTVFTKKYVERGDVAILKAETVALVPVEK